MASDTLAAIANSFTLTSLPDSEVQLIGEIPFAEIEPFEVRALEHLAEEVEMPGFRKGHVPHEMVKKRVGDIALLEEAVELYMRDFYPALIDAKKIDAVGRPAIRITKLAPGNPVGIEIKTAVYPEITLPKDWKGVAATIPLEETPRVEEQEIDNALESIRRAQAKAKNPVVNSSATTKEQDPASHPVTSIPEESALAPLDDAFAQSLGNFTDLEDLRSKMHTNMLEEKALKLKDARRGKIIESLLEKISLSVPSIFVESELDKILSQMKDDITRYGMTFEGYLEQIKKTEEELRTEFRDQAFKRAKLQLVLNKIAADEKIEPEKEAVQNEMKHALEHFPDARPDLLQIHIETVLRNEKVLKVLEKS